MSSMPVRVQLRRSRGWRMPPDTVKVDRSTRWGNPFPAASAAARAEAVARFRAFVAAPGQADLREAIRRELRGRNLACWCPLDGPCHADELLRIANA